MIHLSYNIIFKYLLVIIRFKFEKYGFGLFKVY